MIKTLELNAEDMNELMEHLPDNLKKKLAELIRPDSGIGVVKQFIDEFEDENMLDHIVSHTISNLIRKITGAASSMAKENKKKMGRKGLTTMELGIIVIECLKNEASTIEDAFESHDKKCDRGDKCGVNH